MINPLSQVQPLWPEMRRRSSEKSGSPSESTGSPSAIGGSPSDATARICALLKQLHPEKTAEYVAAATGLSVDAFGKWDSGLANPSAASVALLIWAYGAPMQVAWLGSVPAWLDPAVRADKAKRRADLRAALVARLDALDQS